LVLVPARLDGTMTRIASLPMYDLVEIKAANDAFWTRIAARLRDLGVSDVPSSLTRGTDLHALWTDPSLLLSQTCGYPLTTSLRGKVALLATPCYAAEGCDGPNGRSAIIVRATDRASVLADLRNRTCAINAADSNSGMNLLRAAIAPLAGGAPFFASTLISGAHAESARAVAEGEADLAAIDCVTWALLQRHRHLLASKLRVIAWTDATPWLPFITRRSTSATERSILRQTLQPDKGLLIEGYADMRIETYEIVLKLEQAAHQLQYAQLA
jgi:ABC-type phosphate/phosphonate transport system substrate-binding protein